MEKATEFHATGGVPQKLAWWPLKLWALRRPGACSLTGGGGRIRGQGLGPGAYLVDVCLVHIAFLLQHHLQVCVGLLRRQQRE